MKPSDSISALLYDLLEVPVCVGAPTQGTEKAFSTLRNGGLPAVFGDKARFLPFDGQRHFPEEAPDPRLIGLQTVMGINRRHFERVMHSFAEGRFPISIGGDHSIAIGSIAALGERFGAENTAVLYVDGHTDINTETSSLTGRIHGMPLAAAMGLCSDRLQVGRKKCSLYGKNTYILGARSIDDAEYGILREQGVHLFTAEELMQKGCAAVTAQILAATRGMRLHVSFDVDSIDPSDFSATGYLMPGGLPFSEVLSVLRAAVTAPQTVSFDCVEYNPSLDQTGENLARLLTVFRCFL